MKTYKVQYTLLGKPWKILKDQFGEDYELITISNAKSLAIAYSQLEGYSSLPENWKILDSKGNIIPMNS